jgi:hypothetical protein
MATERSYDVMFTLDGFGNLQDAPNLRLFDPVDINNEIIKKFKSALMASVNQKGTLSPDGMTFTIPTEIPPEKRRIRVTNVVTDGINKPVFDAMYTGEGVAPNKGTIVLIPKAGGRRRKTRRRRTARYSRSSVRKSMRR